jgi:hypothetical protein
VPQLGHSRTKKGHSCVKNRVKQDLLKPKRSVNSVLTKTQRAKKQPKSDTIKTKDGTKNTIHSATKLLTFDQQKDPLAES